MIITGYTTHNPFTGTTTKVRFRSPKQAILAVESTTDTWREKHPEQRWYVVSRRPNDHGGHSFGKVHGYAKTKTKATALRYELREKGVCPDMEGR